MDEANEQGPTMTRDALILECRMLLGEIIEALEAYDSDDGHNQIVLKGIIAESKRIEDAHHQLRDRPKRRTRR